MGNLGGRPGVSAVLIDSAGTVLAAPPDQASMIGRSLNDLPMLSAVAGQALGSTDQGIVALHRPRRLARGLRSRAFPAPIRA